MSVFFAWNGSTFWEMNVILPETNYYFYCPDIGHSSLWQPQRAGIKACNYHQLLLLLFSKHILIPSWQKVGNACIYIESVPPFRLRCLHAPDVFHTFLDGKRTGVRARSCLHVSVSGCLCELAEASALCPGTGGALSAGGWLLLWGCID